MEDLLRALVESNVSQEWASQVHTWRPQRPHTRDPEEPYAAWLSKHAGTGEDAGEADSEGEHIPDLTLSDFPAQVLPQGKFGTVQLQDNKLQHAWSQVHVLEGVQQGPPLQGNLTLHNGILYYHGHNCGEYQEIMVKPQLYVPQVLTLAHTHLLGVCLGQKNTLNRMTEWFTLSP
ncbi:hypothetical protein AAFF_G00378560 [Aldrovandia affinis]|uniref:Uncharacterized protein n=1 Tax=Aldrovandia affinis TaxID=143900 RepID=A0AAD7SFJ1_9TELE|nr:hypothetical protein AAFF_G00378560 [Aldrovandia affinis]